MAKRRRPGPTVEEVLAGRAPENVHQLVALIHEVNPTGRGLRPRDEARAYARKAALQSLLVRLFDEHVLVEESEPGVVALSLRDTGQLAAHCPIDALDEDARARVRYRLDVDAAPSSTPARRVARDAAPSRGGWAAHARAALDAYDYERAEAILRDACASAEGDPSPSRALAELLVDHLGAPQEALDWFVSLPASVRRDADLAGTIGVGAAMAGDAALARELLSCGARTERVNEAWAHLARWAVRRDEPDLAREARDTLAARSPAHPQIRALDDYLDARRQRARADDETALLAVQEGGAEPDELARMARGVLARHSHSAVAARILRELERAATSERICALLAQAQASHDDAAAVPSWREAIALGADPAPFADRLREAEARLHRERVTRSADELAASFGRGELEAALIRALRSDPDVRESVRARVDAPAREVLVRAERIAESDPGVREKAVARAALAFEHACLALEQGDLVATARLLDAHAKLLDPLPEVAALREQMRAARVREACAAADDALKAAERALERGELEAARQSLGRVRTSELEADRRSVHDALAARVDALEHARTLDATLARYEVEGEWLRIAAACDTELERLGADEAALARAYALSSRARQARLRAREAYRLTELPLGEGEGMLPPFGQTSAITTPLVTWSKEGLLVCVTGAASWLIVRWIDIEADRVLRAVCLRPPNAIVACPTSVRVDGQRLSIATSDGFVHTIDVSDATLWGTVQLEDARSNPNAIELIDGSHFAWQLASDQIQARILDTRTGRLRRTVAPFPILQAVDGRPMVLRMEDGGYSVEAFDARGVKQGELVALPGPIVTVDADSDRSVVAVCEEHPGPTFVLVRVDFVAGEYERLLELGEMRALAWSLEAEGGAAYLTRMEGERCVVEAYALEPTAARRWSVELAHALVGPLRDDGVLPLLIPHPGGQRAIAASLVSLVPPELGETGVPCVPWERGPSVRGIPPFPASRSRPPFDAVRMLSAAMALLEHRGDGDSLAAELGQLWSEAPELYAQVVDVLAKRAGLPAALRLWVAQRALDRGRWGQALTVLDEVEAAVQGTELEPWARYARGLVRYAHGEVDSALELWSGLSGDLAHASEYAELVRRLHAEGTDGVFGAVLAAIRTSDERAAAGDRRGAMEVLDRHLVWAACEEQSFARLAALHLEHEPHTGGEWLRKLEVLAELVLRETQPHMMVLAVPGAHWPEGRIQDVRRCARRWLRVARPPGT